MLQLGLLNLPIQNLQSDVSTEQLENQTQLLKELEMCIKQFTFREVSIKLHEIDMCSE
jgi:hypothetical protein